MQLKSSFPLSSANSWEKLQGTNSLCGIGVTQHDQRSLELTQERYSAQHSLLYITKRDDSPASSSSPPSHHGHIRSTWWEEKGGGQGCSPVPPWHFASSHSQADPGKEGRWPLVTWVISVSYTKMHHLFLRTTLENVQRPYCLCVRKYGHSTPAW